MTEKTEWTTLELLVLVHGVAKHGETKWDVISDAVKQFAERENSNKCLELFGQLSPPKDVSISELKLKDTSVFSPNVRQCNFRVKLKACSQKFNELMDDFPKSKRGATDSAILKCTLLNFSD